MGLGRTTPDMAPRQTKLEEFEKPAQQERHATSPISFFQWIVKLPGGKCRPCPGRKEDVLIPRDGDLGAERALQRNLVKRTLVF